MDRQREKSPMQVSLKKLRFFRRAALCVVSVTAVGQVGAQNAEWWPQPTVDPLRWSSLPVDLAVSHDFAAGQFEILLTAGYFNTIDGTWHTKAIHEELGRIGQQLKPDELRLLELRHSEDTIYRLDMEGWRSEMWFAAGIGKGLTMSLMIPSIEIGSPRWDSVSESFHSATGIDQNDRGLFSHGQNLAYVYDHAVLAEGLALEGTGLGDVRFNLSGRLGKSLGASHRLAFSVQAPTGDSDSLFGSGGWNFGLQWAATWSFRRSWLDVAVAYSHLDSKGSWLSAPVSDTMSTLARYSYRFRRTGMVSVEARVDGSPLGDAVGEDLGDPSFFLQLGWRHDLGGRFWIGAVLGEDFPFYSGVQPDFTFQLQLGYGIGRSRGSLTGQ